MVLSRERLDSSLINQAMFEGAFFLDTTLAELGLLTPSSREVFLKQEKSKFYLQLKSFLLRMDLVADFLYEKISPHTLHPIALA